MKHILCAAGLFWAVLPSQVLARLPPIPPPDPAALEAARQLVEQLPVETWSFFQNLEAGRSNAEDAVHWAKLANPDALKDKELERLFAAKVASETKRVLPTCIPEAKEALAESFARSVNAEDAREITAFLATKAGRALAPTINAQPFIATLRPCTYREILPNLPQILSGAIESNNLRKRVNSNSSHLP